MEVEKTNQTPTEAKEQAGGDFFQNKYVWIIGAILLLIAGWFGLKVLFAPFNDYKVTLVNAPETVDAGSIATFTWRVDGSPTTIYNTAVHLGLVSTPGELGKEVVPTDTKYDDFVKDFTNGKFNIPLQFVGNIKMDKPAGKYYFRVHALVKEKNYWSDEYSFELKKPVIVEPSVTVKPSLEQP